MRKFRAGRKASRGGERADGQTATPPSFINKEGDVKKRLIGAGRIAGGVMNHTFEGPDGEISARVSYMDEYRRRVQEDRTRAGHPETRRQCPAFLAGVSDEECRSYREAGLPECDRCQFSEVGDAPRLSH